MTDENGKIENAAPPSEAPAKPASDPVPGEPKPKPPERGLGYWMGQVLVEWKRTHAGFEADPVHDLRVALRRCRTMQQGLRELDPHPDWRAMNAEARRLFRSLGDLRDIQVMLEWLEAIAPDNNRTAQVLYVLLRERERNQTEKAKLVLESFDKKKWRRWAKTLGPRAERIAPDDPAFEYLALLRLHEAHELHRTALRNRTKVSFHRLRVGIKRFRYTVENFLPARHRQWGKKLKRLQDVLGEVHDLDVLWETLPDAGAAFDPAERDLWREIIGRERALRVAEYRRTMVGPQSLWKSFREGLPHGDALHAAALAKLGAWAESADPRFSQTRRERECAVELFDAFARSDLKPFPDEPRLRKLLEAAATLSGAVRAGNNVKKGQVPIGWAPEDWRIVDVVARHAEGRVPKPGVKKFGSLSPGGIDRAIYLIGLLRLGRALSNQKNMQILGVDAYREADVIVMRVGGYRDTDKRAVTVTLGKRPLEAFFGRPLVIRIGPPKPRAVASLADYRSKRDKSD